MDLFIVEVLLATVVLRFALVGALAYVLLSRGSACPHCGTDMAAVRTGWLMLFPGVERRFCTDCGWSGFVRRAAVTPPAPVLPPVVRE